VSFPQKINAFVHTMFTKIFPKLPSYQVGRKIQQLWFLFMLLKLLLAMTVSWTDLEHKLVAVKELYTGCSHEY